jgi:hypothetical protein
MHPNLRAAIDEQYRAFASPKPATIEGCPCCITPEQIDALLATPLRELSYEQLRRYAESALATVGAVENFRYFWPRIAELAVTSEWPNSFDPELVFIPLSYGEWWTWPAHEQSALRGLAAALIERMRDEPLDASLVDSWICAIGQMLDDVTPLLEPLVAGTKAARHNLYGFYDRNRRAIEKRQTLSGRCWDLNRSLKERDGVPNPNVRRIVDWLQRPDVAAEVDQAYAEATTGNAR